MRETEITARDATGDGARCVPALRVRVEENPAAVARRCAARRRVRGRVFHLPKAGVILSAAKDLALR